MDEVVINELKSRHPEVYILTAKGGESIAVRPPTDGEWGAFLDDREKIGSRALKSLVRSCVLFPPEIEFLKLLDKRPALANVFGAKIMEIAGLEEEAQVKKA